MRLLSTLLLLAAPTAFVLAQDAEGSARGEKLEFQSDVARLRKIVINSLYSHRDVFLRELISNANDAIEKLRLTALKDKTLVDIDHPLNITIKAVTESDASKPVRLILTDTGIGMTPEELKANLGTLAKSGTSEFLAQADGENASNLIGQFGVGFYSSFLVASHVYVASRGLPSKENPNPVQYVFSSSADDGSFEVYEDPRGNTLEHGTEITMLLKSDAKEYADATTIKNLVEKHSAFSTTFPIYLFEQKTTEEPVEEEKAPTSEDAEKTENDDDEAVIEDVTDKATPEKKTRTVISDHWTRLNEQPPIWQRDPKDVTEEEYKSLYKATFHDYTEPLAWYHFSGDVSGTAFKAVFFVPSSVPMEFWSSQKGLAKDLRLLVKRVFITNDLGEDALPKWISWIKVIVDADDLPLNVSRETLQNTRFLRQLKNAIIKRFVQLMTKIAEEEPERFETISEQYNAVFKLAALEDEKDQTKLASLVRWDSNIRTKTSLEQYVANRKKGQKQIFYLAGLGQKAEELSKSVFIERLTARGYEVLMFPEPLDEILTSKLRKFGGMKFQDAAKQGLKFGDEDEDSENEKENQKALEETYKPLVDWLTKQVKHVVSDVKISQRLVSSPCAIVAHQYGMSANMERLMKAQAQQKGGLQQDWQKTLKTLEINPKSPLIEGLLKRVEQLPENEIEADEETLAELNEVASILIDSALVRSGFEVSDPNLFFTRIDHVLRRSLGVSEKLEAPKDVKPAPPVETGPMNEEAEDDEPAPGMQQTPPGFGEDFVDWKDFKAKRDKEQGNAGQEETLDFNVNIPPAPGADDETKPHDEL